MTRLPSHSPSRMLPAGSTIAGCTPKNGLVAEPGRVQRLFWLVKDNAGILFALAGLLVLSSYFATAKRISTAPANRKIPVLIQHGTDRLHGEELQEARVLASQMTAEREHWEHKVSLLRPEGIDPDMLEERARLLLNYLRDDEIVIRMSGCPNGCSRPYLGEIALVGKAPGRYNLMLGADHRGLRLNVLYRENITEPQILAELEPLFERYAAARQPGEGFGDFLLRTGVVDVPEKDRRSEITIEAMLIEEPA